MLASLYPCMSVLLMDVHSLLSDIQTAKLQIKTHLFLFLNSLTILELISRYPSFIFYPMWYLYLTQEVKGHHAVVTPEKENQ